MDAQLRLLTAGSTGDTPASATPAPTARHASRHAARRAPRRAAAARPALAEHHDPVEAPSSWRIDDTTRAVGRSGLALARAALREARPVLAAEAAFALVDHAQAPEVGDALVAPHATPTAA